MLMPDPNRTHPALPGTVYLVGGAEDPATNMGREIRWLGQRMLDVGMTDVETTVYDGMRHETLNEIEPMRGQAVTALRRFVASCAAKGAVTQPAPALPE